MGIQSILNALASVKSQDPSALDSGIALPKNGADPKAVDAFTRQMEGAGQTDPAGQIQGPQAATAQPEAKELGPAEPLAHSLGRRITAKDPAGDIREPEKGQVTQWLDSVTDILGKDSFSHADLFRVQALAGLAQIEASRNAAINESLDNSLRTLIKNT